MLRPTSGFGAVPPLDRAVYAGALLACAVASALFISVSAEHRLRWRRGEKQHIVEALRFELGKVEVPEVRERVVGMLAHVDRTLAGQVAEGLGLGVPKPTGPMNRSVPADAIPGSSSRSP